MKQKKNRMNFQRSTTRVLVGILFMFAFSVVAVLILARIDRKFPYLNNTSVNFILKEAGLKGLYDMDSPHKSIEINWAIQYPFEEENIFKSTTTRQPIWNTVVVLTQKIRNRVLRYSEERLFFRRRFVEAAMTIEKNTGMNFIKNTTSTSSFAVLDNDYLGRQVFFVQKVKQPHFRLADTIF